MPKLESVTDGKSISVQGTETILEAFQDANIPHTSACGGQAYCSTCRVIVLKGIQHCSPPTAAEKALAKRLNFPVHVRLACQTRITDDVSVRRLVIDDDDLELVDSQFTSSEVGIEQPVALLMASVRGATNLDEVNFPYDILYIMSRYFRSVRRIVTAYGGSIDSHMGGRFIATFRSAGSPEDARRSLWAGQEILAAVEELNRSLQKLAYQPLSIRIGIHYGRAIMVPVAAGESESVVPLGGAVGITNTILSANQKFGTQFLVSEPAYKAAATEILPGQVETILRDDRQTTLTVYEVLEMEGQPPQKIALPERQKPAFGQRWRAFMQRFGLGRE